MTSIKNGNMQKIGVPGAAITALCCLKLLLFLFPAAGLAVWRLGADMGLYAALAVFAVVILWMRVRRRGTGVAGGSR